MLLAKADTIQPRDLHLEFNAGKNIIEEGPALTFREAQIQNLRKALQAENGNIARTAARLEMTRSSLYNKLKTFGISAHEYQNGQKAPHSVKEEEPGDRRAQATSR